MKKMTRIIAMTALASVLVTGCAVKSGNEKLDDIDR